MKTDVKNDICWSKIGSGFVEPGGTSPPRIPRSIPLGHVVSTTNCFQRELYNSLLNHTMRDNCHFDMLLQARDQLP